MKSGYVKIRSVGIVLSLFFLLGIGGELTNSLSEASDDNLDHQDTKIGWLWYGPKNDGGWNVSNAQGQLFAREVFGSRYDEVEAENVPFSDQAGVIAEQFILKNNANVLIDTAGFGKIFSLVCDRYPDIFCIQVAPSGPIGKNMTGYFPPIWISEYSAGYAAGLVTTSNLVGYVLAYDAPLVKGAANAFALGCRAANSNCQIQISITGDYFDPEKTAKAVSILIKDGADVVRSYTDDQGYCDEVKKHGALAIGVFRQVGPDCGESLLTSTIFDFGPYFGDVFSKIDARKFSSQQLEWLEPSQVFSLGSWGA